MLPIHLATNVTNFYNEAMEAMLSDDEVKTHVAANLRRLLADRGWSQGELARRTGEDVMTISRACNGKNIVGSGVLARIAEALDVSLDRLVSAPPTGNIRQTA